VLEGDTVVEVSPVTFPTPSLIVSDVAFAVVHDSTDDWPAVMDEGVATKELMVGIGGKVVADATDEAADTFPTLSSAVT
jgi:hypothetical protein